MDDLISRAAAQTELQLSARRYTVAHEAHGEGRVVWSEDLISVSDAMDVLRKIPPAEPTFDARDTQYNLPIGKDVPDTNVGDTISRQQAIDDIWTVSPLARLDRKWVDRWLRQLPSAQPEIIRCKDCKYNPKHEWFGCPMSHLNEKQRPETAWCWKAERREVTT